MIACLSPEGTIIIIITVVQTVEERAVRKSSLFLDSRSGCSILASWAASSLHIGWTTPAAAAQARWLLVLQRCYCVDSELQRATQEKQYDNLYGPMFMWRHQI